jgi:hypothetical protein
MTTVRVVFGTERIREAVKQQAANKLLYRDIEIATRSIGARTLELDFPQFKEPEDTDYIQTSWRQVVSVEVLSPQGQATAP